MEIPEIEVRTFRSIAKPGKAIPGLDDDELAFLLGYLIFSILFMIFGLGMVPNMLGIKIPSEYMSTIMQIIFAWLPGLTLLFLKIFKMGKQEGYIFQKMYLFFNSSLPEKIDMREKDQMLLAGKIASKPLNFLKSKELYKKSELYKNFNLEWDSETEHKKIDKLNKNLFTYYKTYKKNKKQINNMWTLEVKKPVEQLYKQKMDFILKSINNKSKGK